MRLRDNLGGVREIQRSKGEVRLDIATPTVAFNLRFI